MKSPMRTGMKITAFCGSRAPWNEAIVARVYEDGHSDALPMHLDVVNHSPAGFEWGYGGSGPAQLALAVCVELVGAARAERVHQDIKWHIFAPLMQPNWELRVDEILRAILYFEADPDARPPHWRQP
jgi:Family of unknown function (DUF6166)